ncbi:MAG: OmpA family protein [Calditrichae bacterium]|nr:OmpA family protein [Calditrichia bacterium]
MHYLKTYLTVILLLFFWQQAFSQLKNQDGFGLGLESGSFLGQSDFGRSATFSPNIMGFLRYSISGPFHGEISAGYGQIIHKDIYETTIYPVQNRIFISPFSMKYINPYAYAGVGFLYYEVSKVPQIADKSAAKNEWTGFAPIGLGLQVRLADNLALEINGGYSYLLTDVIDAVDAGEYDGFWSFSTGISVAFPSGSADSDGDGIINSQEENLGINPDNPDTDNDGLTDYDELYRYKTRPQNSDSDLDGLNDYDEIFTYKSNPNLSDTDDDGLKDPFEINEYKTNPLKADTDEDGLNDNDEINKFKTDPLAADTDNDKIKDGEELNSYKTDPLNADSDMDKLSDGDEILTYKTDPLIADSDGGTLNDGMEIEKGTNPLDKSDDVVEPKLLGAGIGIPVIMKGVYFRTNSSEISTESEIFLQDVVNTLKDFPEAKIEIRGHTDNTGDANYNFQLSQDRADAVKEYLVHNGIDPFRIASIGFGETKPIAENDTKVGRQKNRRIEFVRTE